MQTHSSTLPAESFFENNRRSILNDNSGLDFGFDPGRFGQGGRIIQDQNRGLA